MSPDRQPIDDCGRFRWGLAVADGHVVASRHTPGMASLYLTTETGLAFDAGASVGGLDPTGVVARYCRRSDTEASLDDLLARVREALSGGPTAEASDETRLLTDGGHPGPVTLDETLSLLSNSRRRHVIRYLSRMDDGGTVALREVIDHVTAIENGQLEAGEANRRQAVYVSLWQGHLDKLEQAGAITRPDEHAIRRGEHIEAFVAALDALEAAIERDETLVADGGVCLPADDPVGIPDECQLCPLLDYRGEETNEPTHSTEVGNTEGGSKIVYHCARCGEETFTSDLLTDPLEQRLVTDGGADVEETDREIVAEIAKARIDDDASHLQSGGDEEDLGYVDYSFAEAKEAVERFADMDNAMAADDTEHPEPAENVGFNEEVIQHVDYLLWSHGASNAVRARIKAEMCDKRPPEWAVDAAGDLGQPKPPAECSRDTKTDRQEHNSPGLFEKYEVRKGGEPVESCFVLEPRSDSAAREALIRYAAETDNDQLAEDLRAWVTDLCTRGDQRE